MDMNIDVAYLFRGGQAPDSADTATSQRQKPNSTVGLSRPDADPDHVDIKLSREPISASEHSKERCGPSSISSGEPYANAYATSGRQSLRLSTASYSTVGELEMASHGELSANRDKRKIRGACEEQPKGLNAYGVRPTETYLCASGPPSTTHTPLATPPSSTTLTDRGPDDTLRVAELQEKLEVSYEWAYELERDVADLSLEVEGLRDVCAQLKHSLHCKEQELAEAQLSNCKLRKHLASADVLLQEHMALCGHPHVAAAAPTSSHSCQEYQSPAAYQRQILSSSSSPMLQSMQFTAPRSGEARVAMPPAVAAGAYPTLTPLRTSLSSPSMQSAAPGRGTREGMRPAAAYPPSSTDAPGSQSGGAARWPSQRLGSQH